jgi:hypothetical protein
MTTYSIIRYFANNNVPEHKSIIKSGLTLEEATEHCKDKETSSSTATSDEAQYRTMLYGPWFDGREEE